MTDLNALIRLLREGGVEFIIVGGAAATAHGSVRLTLDLDIVYDRSNENIARLVSVLKPLQPYLRGAPPGLPFDWSEETVHKGLNFTLITTLGAIDLLGEITGGGNYENLLSGTVAGGWRRRVFEPQFRSSHSSETGRWTTKRL